MTTSLRRLVIFYDNRNQMPPFPPSPIPQSQRTRQAEHNRYSCNYLADRDLGVGSVYNYEPTGEPQSSILNLSLSMPTSPSVCAGVAHWGPARRAAGAANAGEGEEWGVLGARVHQLLSPSSTSTYTGRAEPARATGDCRRACWLLNHARGLHVRAWWRSACCRVCVPTGYSVVGLGRSEKVNPCLRAAGGKGSGLGRDGYLVGVVPALVNFPSPELILQSRSAHFRVTSLLPRMYLFPSIIYDIPMTSRPKRRAFSPTMEPSLLAPEIPIYAKRHSLVTEMHRQ